MSTGDMKGDNLVKLLDGFSQLYDREREQIVSVVNTADFVAVKINESLPTENQDI